MTQFSEHQEQRYQAALAASGMPTGSRQFFEAGLAARDVEFVESCKLTAAALSDNRKLKEIVALQAKALDHYSFMGEFNSFYVSNDGQDIADRAKAKCNKLLEEL